MQRKLTLQEVLERSLDEPSADDPLERYVEITPRALAMLGLRDCNEQLARTPDEPLRLAQAAKSAHLALQAALIVALAGSANIGAYDDDLRSAYLAYFESSRESDSLPPRGDRVMPFPKLLARAMEHPMEWSGRKLEVDAHELEALERLTFIRHRIEHPRPAHHFVEPRFIALTLPIAARLTLELLDVVSHHYEPGERSRVAADVCSITAICARFE